MTATRERDPDIQELERVTIRFAGDSGDGMQLTGTQFTRTAAVFELSSRGALCRYLLRTFARVTFS